MEMYCVQREEVKGSKHYHSHFDLPNIYAHVLSAARH